MTLVEALKVAQEELFGRRTSSMGRQEAAAVLASLEAELPKVLKDAGGYLPYAADVLPDPGEADHVRGIVQRIDDLLYGTNLAGMNPARLDAAPKEGS